MLHQRQAGAAIEGVVRQTAVATLERLAVDTHGYTDFGMAIAKLLGFDLCPRLSHFYPSWAAETTYPHPPGTGYEGLSTPHGRLKHPRGPLGVRHALIFLPLMGG